MNGLHPTDEVFGLFVSGQLDPATERVFARHLRTCRACEGRLQTEARVEWVLERLWQPSPTSVGTRFRGDARPAAAAMFATAAALLLMLSQGARHSSGLGTRSASPRMGWSSAAVDAGADRGFEWASADGGPKRAAVPGAPSEPGVSP